MGVQSTDVDLDVTASADHDRQLGGPGEPAARALRRELFTDEVIDQMLVSAYDLTCRAGYGLMCRVSAS